MWEWYQLVWRHSCFCPLLTKLNSAVIFLVLSLSVVQPSVQCVRSVFFSLASWTEFVFFIFFVATQENVWAKSYFWAFFSQLQCSTIATVLYTAIVFEALLYVKGLHKSCTEVHCIFAVLPIISCDRQIGGASMVMWRLNWSVMVRSEAVDVLVDLRSQP